MRRQQLSEAQITALLDPPTDQRELGRHYTLSAAASQRSAAVVAIVIASATPSCFAFRRLIDCSVGVYPNNPSTEWLSRATGG